MIAGPVLPQIARVKQNGFPASGKSITITITGAAAGSISGVTDANGEFRFTYVPPHRKTVDVVSASCGGCSNTATKPITVDGPEVQFCPAESGTLFGNPIMPGSAEKIQAEEDWGDSGPHPLRFTRHYRSAGTVFAGLGVNWSHNYAARLVEAQGDYAVHLPDGGTLYLTREHGSNRWRSDSGEDLLTQTSSGMELSHIGDDRRWLFDANGPLLNITQSNGWAMTFAYDGIQLASVTNAFGRSLHFVHDAQGRLIGVNTPDGQQIRYTFDSASRLASVIYPDHVSRSYLYEDSLWPGALTGIVDEAGVRYASFAYDDAGRAVSTSRSGGAQGYTANYGSASTRASGRLVAGAVTDPSLYHTSVQVIDPLGNAQIWSYVGGNGTVRVRGVNAPFEGSRVANRSGSPDLPDSETDFLGVQTLFTWDAARRLPLSTTRAANRPEVQTTGTQWHPTFRLPALIAEAGRTTAYTYDAQGNRLSETVTDTATGQARTWQWSYLPNGLTGSVTGPRGGVWRHGYDVAGNRTSVKNPQGLETQYAYDAAGRVIRQTAPSGLVTTYAYDQRGRLVQIDQGDETTTYRYTPSGQLAGMTLPSGYQASYRYDAAQRLVGASDNLDHSIQYTLDAMGNRVREEVRDARGNLALATGRVINSLNRVAAIQGAQGQTTVLDYDANGEPVSATDPLNQTTRQSLDGLRRPVATTFADNASASQAWDALGELAAVTDPKGVQTSYDRNAFGDITRETSLDSGTTTYQHDAAGNITARTDARGLTSLYEYDSLNRLVHVTHADGSAAHYRYDASDFLSEIEDASGITAYEHDQHGRVTAKTQTLRDNSAVPSQYRVRYAYSGGQLSQVTYPSGLQVHYRRRSGQITGVDVQPPGPLAGARPFVTDLTPTPLGQPKAWRWASGDSAQRSFDADARMTASEIASYQYDAAGRISALTQNLWTDAGAASSAAAATAVPRPFSWTVGYDRRNRVTSFTRTTPGSTPAVTQYSWDANGNRLSAHETSSGDIDLGAGLQGANQALQTAIAPQLEPASNRLLGFAQTLNTTQNGRTVASSTTQVSYTLDAAGNLIGDGLRRFQIDASGRVAGVATGSAGDETTVSYLHNALGQRVFKSEPKVPTYVPSEEELGSEFTSWLRKYFGQLFTVGASTAQLGQAYIYDETGALLAEYGNGGSNSASMDLIWLPTDGGQSLPIGLHRDGRLYAIHPDHLGTPRLITDEANQPVWQWPYSAFGTTAPTGVLKVTGAGASPNANANPKAQTATAERLERTEPRLGFNLRYPGQYYDAESNLFYNYFRSYQPNQGRYTQADPIGLRGGLNPFTYVSGQPLTAIDPTGLLKFNKPAPSTVPPEGETFDALVCLETCLKGTTGNLDLNLLVTGGAEKTGHSSKSHHSKGEACDIASPRSNKGVTDADAKMCAKACGFGAGHYETFPNNPNRDHWHFQLTPGNGVSAL